MQFSLFFVVLSKDNEGGNGHEYSEKCKSTNCRYNEKIRMTMIKLRVEATNEDIDWVLKMLETNKKVKIQSNSESLDIKGTKRYKRMYIDLIRSENE